MLQPVLASHLPFAFALACAMIHPTLLEQIVVNVQVLAGALYRLAY